MVVRDERRGEFASVEALRRRRGLKVGVPLDTRQLAFSIDRYFGGAGAEFVVFKSAGEFFDKHAPGIDAFLMPAEGGAAFTLLHPEFTVVVPQPDPVKLPYAFGLAPDAERMADAVNEWIVFAQSEGMIQRAYDYWVLGRGAEDAAPALVDPPQRDRLAPRRRAPLSRRGHRPAATPTDASTTSPAASRTSKFVRPPSARSRRFHDGTRPPKLSRMRSVPARPATMRNQVVAPFSRRADTV